MNFLDFREPVSTWSHCAGVLLALPGTFLLWRRSAGEPTKRLTLLVYGLTLAFCYSASTLYHGVRLPAAGIAAFARLDGVGIFALIAGSYTPLAWCLLRGHWRRWTLAVVWSVAATATILIAAGRHFSPGAGDLPVPGDGLGRRRLLFRDRAGRVAPCLAAHRRRRPVLQRRGGAQPAALACPLAGDLRGSRAVSLLRAGGQPGSLPVHSQGRRAVRAGGLRGLPRKPRSLAQVLETVIQVGPAWSRWH